MYIQINFRKEDKTMGRAKIQDSERKRHSFTLRLSDSELTDLDYISQETNQSRSAAIVESISLRALEIARCREERQKNSSKKQTIHKK